VSRLRRFAATPPLVVPISELALVAIAAVWGLTFVMVQDAIERLEPMAFLGYRFLPAGVLVALVFWRPLRRMPAEGWRFGFVLGIFLTAGYIAQTLGLEHTTASNAGFITGLFVVLTPLFGSLAFGLNVGRATWVAVILSAVGLLLLSGAGGDLNLNGDGVVLICACSFAIHILLTSRAVARFEVGALVAVELVVCGLFCLGYAAAAGQLEQPRGGTVWSALIVTSLVASALGFLVQSYAQRYAPPTRTALILAAEPAFAGLFGYLLQDERLSMLAWMGAVLIMVAIVLVDVVPGVRVPRPLPEG
jgi:drug/metabolite transporter (DMT)-like permease